MSVSGAKPKPHLQAVREGTFRADRQTEGARFAPVDPVEPDWAEVFPSASRGALAKEAKELRDLRGHPVGTHRAGPGGLHRPH